MTHASTFVALWQLTRVGVFCAVLVMAAWNTYICLRLRPDVATVFINLSFWAVPVLALATLTGRVWQSLTLGTALTFVFQRLHWLKWKYMYASWTAADFRMVADASNWVVVEQYPEILAFLILCLALLIATWVATSRRSRLAAPGRVLAAILTTTLIIGVAQARDRHPFDPFGFNLYGHFASLVYSWPTLEYRAPVVDTDSAYFVGRMATLPQPDSRTAATLPDIVIWLQESTIDLALLDLPQAQFPRLEMYRPDPFTRAHGLLRVPAWGGSTWLSEFSLLTGLDVNDFGPSAGSVYYTVTPRVRFTLPRTLKALGYRSVALSGSPKGIYNMERAQRDLGFDEVLNPLDFPEWQGKSLATHYISDEQLGQFALQVLDRRREQPLLLFVLSIMQHGPYRTDRIAYGLDRTGLDGGTAARLTDFADRMVDTSESCRRFGADLLARPRPTVFAYFGDHHPNLDGEVPFRDGLEDARYTTAYALKTNYPGASSEGGPVLDIVYLATVVLEHAGIPLDGFFKANRAMRQLCHGRFSGCEDRALTASYRAYVYRDLEAATPVGRAHALVDDD